MSVRRIGLKANRFHDLIPYRVREVLLVSSPYDAFILEEDGQLTEQVFIEYQEVSASGPPRFTHVPTSKAALRLLSERRFDLVLAMSSLPGMGINAFGRRVKEMRPGRPVVLLALDRQELDQFKDRIDNEAIDGTFLWSGDSQILLAIIKFIEDRMNAAHDVEQGNIRVIITIEDSPRYYSAFLGMLYKELMAQSRSLSLEGVNELHRRMVMRSRPKILLATSYEQGLKLFDRYHQNVLAVISDVRIPRAGELDGNAGLDFARHACAAEPDLPVLLQSAEPHNATLAAEIGANFVDKNSATLLAEIRDFLTDRLGFGDFIFRLPDGREVDRAGDLRQLEKKLQTVADESLAYHAHHNHFSIWLMARSEFELAESLRPRTMSDFGSVEALRAYLVSTLRTARKTTFRGIVTDFRRERFEHDLISRLGSGALGGKGRGIAFLNRRLADVSDGVFGELEVQIPKTVVITTEYFDRFLEDNALVQFAYECSDDMRIAQRFLQAPLPPDLTETLQFLVEEMDVPLAVRSSSLLEDSLHQPFAGIYSTLMIPNSAPDPAERLADLSAAVKLVYASTFCRNARSYLSSTGSRIEEEKMAVIVQRIVGRQRGNRFYPSFSGVAQSFNFYPVGPQRAKDGIVHVALGLGRLVVDGGKALRFSPKHPAVLPQFANPKAYLEASQNSFYALDMEQACCDPGTDLYTNVQEYDLVDAEVDGSLHAVGSVYAANDHQIRDDLRLSGPRVVTFNNILKYKAIPLAPALDKLLTLTRKGFATPVEIEFACELGDWGRQVSAGKERQLPELYALQVRPFVARGMSLGMTRLRFAPEDVICRSSKTLGHGVETSVSDIVYVRRDRWEAAKNKAIAAEVEELNSRMGKQKRPYMLIGPGRWGTSDEWLGIPVQWRQISNAKAIVEASPAGYDVEPSQGTHFFQNITSLRIAYLTLPPGVEREKENALDWLWLDAQPAHHETEHLRHLRFDSPLTIVLDGKKSQGLVAKPGAVGS